MKRIILLLSLPFATLLSSATTPPVVEAHALAHTFGGVLLQASFLPRGRDNLTGVWYEGGHAKLMRCSPRCEVIKKVPLEGPLMIGQDSTYRVVMAGSFRSGQRLKVMLRFDDLQLVTLTVPVND
ncbi:hypothetical protein [Deinococcus sonorensis]|uniref:Proteinase inhibitor I42 chagasin domain-containing protein n=2 Tax=Deinococcus sonorensis TaxID=309891 RepID=A0AAU7U8J8_9DEIO